jgi:hypothetical protein
MLMYLASLLTLVWLAGAQDVSTKTLELELLVEAEPEILFNHVNLVQFTLTSPYGSTAVEAIGEFYAEEPEIYYQTLEPVVWRLELPENSTNELAVEVTATLALCDKPKGICYLHDVVLKEVVDISQETNKETLTVHLSRLEY